MFFTSPLTDLNETSDIAQGKISQGAKVPCVVGI